MTKKLTIFTNPPYQPPIGVKKGGGFFNRFIVELDKMYEPDETIMIVPFTWQVRLEDEHVRQSLKNAGLMYFKHVHPDAFDKSVLTVYFRCKRGHNGNVIQEVYTVDDVNNYVTVDLEITKDILPVVRSIEEAEMFSKIWSHRKYDSSVINGDKVKEYHSGVEYPYLIGLEKEKLNIKNPMRKIKVKYSGTKLGTECSENPKNVKFIPTENDQEADKLAKMLEETGQQFLRCIPRGSSLENWMVNPLVGYFRRKQHGKFIL